MSRFLAEPLTEKSSEDVSGNGLAIGKSSMQGWRDTMEDQDLIQLPLHPSTPDITLVAVFDGHGGASISQAIANEIVDHIVRTEEFKTDPRSPESLAAALCKGFLSADSSLQHNPDFASKTDEIGSTGLVALLTPSHVLSANVGDSRAILSLKSGAVEQLSLDHKPDMELERQRIFAAGGTVFRGRVCGGVAVSRSFGDFWFKRNEELAAHQQLVTAEPCIGIHKRRSDDHFLLLACDGIFDVMSNDQLVAFVQSKAARTKSPSAVCEALLDECLRKGSRDNMSAVLVLF